MPDGATITTVSLLIAVISLDRTVVGQIMISQPLVGGWLLGLALGDPVAGLTAGTLFQFLSLTDLPIGASIPPDTSLAGLIGAGLYLAYPRPAGWSDTAFLGLLLLFFLPLAYLCRAVDGKIRHLNRLWTAVVRVQIEKNRFRTAQWAALGGIMFTFLKAFVLSALVLGIFSLWCRSGPGGREGFTWGLELFTKLVPLLGLASVFSGRRYRRRATALTGSAGLVLGAALSWYIL